MFCVFWQKKLEQLLLKYPPEEIESKRWQKIADELGNRTAKQVRIIRYSNFKKGTHVRSLFVALILFDLKTIKKKTKQAELIRVKKLTDLCNNTDTPCQSVDDRSVRPLIKSSSCFSHWNNKLHHFPLTTSQVASRVQKYFIKLTKAGIPVPGRTPNLCMYTKKVTHTYWITHFLT